MEERNEVGNAENEFLGAPRDDVDVAIDLRLSPGQRGLSSSASGRGSLAVAVSSVRVSSSSSASLVSKITNKIWIGHR